MEFKEWYNKTNTDALFPWERNDYDVAEIAWNAARKPTETYPMYEILPLTMEKNGETGPSRGKRIGDGDICPVCNGRMR